MPASSANGSNGSSLIRLGSSTFNGQPTDFAHIRNASMAENNGSRR